MHMACSNATKDIQDCRAGKCWVALQGPDTWVCTILHSGSFQTPTAIIWQAWGAHFKQAPRWHWSCWLVTTIQGPLCSTPGPQRHTGMTWESSGEQSKWTHCRKHQHPCSLDLSWESLVGGRGVSITGGLGLAAVLHLSHPISLRHSTENSFSKVCLLLWLTSLLLHSQRKVLLP